VPGISVAVSLIDAHAGGIGLLGMSLEPGDTGTPLESRMAMIMGSSTCHMAVAHEGRFVPGVWGPYYSAMIPRWWLAEGGQSATGLLVDRIIDGHALGSELRSRAVCSLPRARLCR
jgi:ribulose kinase